VDAGLVALAPLGQASGHVGDRDAVELTVLDKRWPVGLDCLGAEPPPCSQGTLGNCRMRRIAPTLDKTLLERTVALAEKTGGCGARQLRAVLDAPPLFGAGRGEDTLHLLGHALRKAVGLAAQALGPSAPAVVAAAGLTLVGHSSLTAALDLDGGEPRARAHALGLGLEEVARWPHWLEPQHTLAAQAPPLQEVMETIAQIRTPETDPDPDGEPGGRRIKPPIAPDRRSASEAQDRRPGRTSSAKPFNGFQEHLAVDVASQVTREVGVRPAHEPEHAVVEWLAEALEKAPGLVQLDSDLGDMASPRMAQGAEQGVYIIARPWPPMSPLFTKHACPLDCARRQVTCAGGQRVPMVPGRQAQVPAAAGDACAVRAPWTKATHGPGRSLSIREDEQCQQKLRAKMKTPRGRASLCKRTAVEHTMAQQLAHQGRRARDKGLRKNQFDGRRHAAVSNLQVAAHYEEEHRLAS
jgi:hypothetical protein